jgi:RimJ/RimL family protein N-acetyltransferase
LIPVWDHPQEVADFVSIGLWGVPGRFSNYQGLGFATETSGIIAGVVYHNFDPCSGAIELSAFSSRRDWLNRSRLRAVFAYPFEQLRVRICVARISEHNTRTLRIWRAFGASLHTIPDLRGDGEAEIIAVLHRDAWTKSKFAR